MLWPVLCSSQSQNKQEEMKRAREKGEKRRREGRGKKFEENDKKRGQFLASQDALEVIVSLSEWVTLRTELTDVTLVREDTYWRLYWETLIINDTYGGDVRVIVVLIMEVDKVVDEVTDMEIDK